MAVLTSLRRHSLRCQVMNTPKKFIPPDIARDELTPRELELLAVLEQLTDMVNRQQERLQALEEEISQLRKARKRA
jgi:predicted nuclease with TOPRIM domain